MKMNKIESLFKKKTWSPEISLEIKKIWGVDVIGFAQIKDIEHTFHSSIPRGIYSTALIFGIRIFKEVLETIKDSPTLIYKHHYKTINWVVDQKAIDISIRLQKSGFKALPIASSQIIDWENQKAALSHILVGILAKIGWKGKSNLLIHPEHGPRLRYATILTDFIPCLESSKKELVKSKCQECRICIESCPAQAINEGGFNKEKCYQKLKEFQAIKGIGQAICGICIKVCPIGLD
jgi:epoxyqueuosine reductase QueG